MVFGLGDVGVGCYLILTRFSWDGMVLGTVMLGWAGIRVGCCFGGVMFDPDQIFFG